jgi:Agenet domain
MTMTTTYNVNEAVEVHSFGRWYPGVIVKVGRTRVVVRYTTGSGMTRDKAFSLDRVRNAEEVAS